VFGFVPGLMTGCLFAVLAFGLWYGFQYLRRLQTGDQERAISVREQTMSETTPLDQRIAQMLTEARVVLPGVQALLGFQLIAVLSQSFANLPTSSKVIHAASLGCMTMAVILLMTPPAYHRIVFAGQDTEEVHHVGSLLITSATVPLALGLAGDVYVVLAKITGSSEVGGLIAAITLLFLVGLWHAFPLFRRRRRHFSEGMSPQANPDPSGS
jgi:hypothetical protein